MSKQNNGDAGSGASERSQMASSAGQHLKNILKEIDRLSEVLRPRCDEATVDKLDAGADLITQAVKAALDPETETQTAERALRAA